MTRTRSKLTPPEVARLWGVSPDKVLAWIRAGELRAVNAATTQHGRPRYLIDRADLAAFEQRRAATPAPAAGRRRRTPAQVIEFF
jgi:excisionase family DNA binding protein